jgi:hypothetical protein
MLRKIGAMAILAVAVAGCNESTTYELSADAVRSRLLSIGPPMMVFGSQAGGSMTTQPDANSVRWTVFGPNRKPVMSLVATIEAQGDSRAAVSVAAEPAQGNSKVAQGMSDNPQIVTLYRDAMREQIDAKLTGRDFDMTKIQAQMMAAAIATMPKMAKQLDEASKHFKEMDRERDAAQAEADYRRDQRETMRAAEGSDTSSSDSSSSSY